VEKTRRLYQTSGFRAGIRLPWKLIGLAFKRGWFLRPAFNQRRDQTDNGEADDSAQPKRRLNNRWLISFELNREEVFPRPSTSPCRTTSFLGGFLSNRRDLPNHTRSINTRSLPVSRTGSNLILKCSLCLVSLA
jgi:hypothetical protein